MLDDDFDRDDDCLLDPGRVKDDLGLRDCPWEALGVKVPALPWDTAVSNTTLLWAN